MDLQEVEREANICILLVLVLAYGISTNLTQTYVVIEYVADSAEMNLHA
jgi:hypothetical protein